MKLLRRALAVFLVLLLLVAGGIGYLVATFDPEAFKPRIEAAVEQSLGRRLTLAGPIRISTSLIPTIVAENVSLANIDGGTRPAMLSVARLELRIALLPLLARQLDIRRVLLVQPDILLEPNAEGRPNWVFTPAARPVAPAPATPAPEAAASRQSAMRVEIAEVLIEGGRVTLNSPVIGRAETLDVARLGLRADAPDASMQIDGRLAFAGQAFTLRGEIGHLLRLTGDRPWPYRIAIASALLDAQLEGSMARAVATQDWQAHLRATIPALAALQPVSDALQRGVQLPAARDVRIDAQILVQGNRLVPRALTVTTGAVDLSALRPGLSLTRLEIAAPAPDQPIRLSGDGQLGAAPLSVSGSFGTPAAFDPGAAPAPFPVDLAVQAAGARLTLAGQVGAVQRFGHAALNLTVHMPDLAALSPLAGQPLPALGAVEASARIETGAEGIGGPLHLHALRIAAAPIALEGALTLEAGARPALRGRLSGPRLDIDALQAAFAPQAPAANGNAPATPPAPAGPRRVIPNTPIRLDSLRLFDAALDLAIAELRAQGTTYRDLATTLALEGGRARLAPFAVTLPGGRIAGTLAADASGDVPALDMALRHDGEGLDLGPLLSAYRLPAYASGRLGFSATLAGSGADVRTLLGGANGRLALSMAGGRVEIALLSAIPASLRGLILPPGAAENGLALRCLALLAPVQDGVVTTEVLLLDTPIGRVGGGGTIRLSNEALALRLLPDVRLGPIQLRTPVRVTGTLANPNFAAPDAANAAIGAGINAILGAPERGLRDLGRLLDGGGVGGGIASGCGGALAAARDAEAPAAPAAPEAAEPPADPAQAQPPAQDAPAPRRSGGERAPRPADVLRGILRELR